MAGSRLEKFGTIYKRVQGLLRSGALKPADRPMWCDVYEAFPPIDPPEYDRPIPDRVVPRILYPEDMIRVQFYKTYGNPDVVDLTNQQVKTTCQRFVEKCLDLLQSGSGGDVFGATATALKEEGLRLRLLEEVQHHSTTPAGSPAPAASSAPSADLKVSVASIFGEDTVARASRDDDWDHLDPTENDPKL